MSVKSILRLYKKTPVIIEEDHNEVLKHIFRSVGAKHLPVNQNVIIHFDSHPDLGIPFRLKDDDTSNIHLLYEKLSIESWILPAAYLGVITNIVWVCPPWCLQFPEGLHNFFIGKHRLTGKILVTSTEPYFTSEGLTCNESELENKREVSLTVFKMTSENLEDKKQIQNFLSDNQHFILDIDLDFYSTKNPFLDLFPDSNVYPMLKTIYKFAVTPKSLTAEESKNFALELSEKRNLMLEKLMDLTDHVQEHRSFEGYEGIGLEYVSQMKEVQTAIVEKYGEKEEIDWRIIHNAGCTCDDIELPHHVSTQEEIRELIDQTKTFLHLLRAKPTLVTIARSSLDDFCPQDQVEFIQNLAVETVADFFGGKDKIEVKLEYQNQIDDVN